MRVIAGKAKGRQLKTPRKNWAVRPLTDQARAALFNILGETVVGANFLDLFAGTGAVGIEALSRGARRAVFVEINRQVAELIRQNLALTGFTESAEIYNMAAGRSLNLLSPKGEKFELIFVGAPYDSPELEPLLIQLAELELLTDRGIVIAEHRKQHQLSGNYGKLKRFREAQYGETVLDFLRC